MIRTIIVDDELPAIDELEYLLSECETIEVVNTFLNPVKALEYLLINEVDVCFVDVSMPLMNGFEFASALSRFKNPPIVVFATAYDEYAIQAFEINAVDYILKPISKERLKLTCKRIEKSIVLESNGNVFNAVKEIKRVERIPLWKNDRMNIVPIDCIIYIEVADSKTTVYTVESEYITNDSLQYFSDLLPEDKFYRCHRNFIINLDEILEVIPWFNNTYVVKVNKYDKEIPISRRNLKQFKQLLNL